MPYKEGDLVNIVWKRGDSCYGITEDLLLKAMSRNPHTITDGNDSTWYRLKDEAFWWAPEALESFLDFRTPDWIV